MALKLADNGYHVLLYDLYGRGYSDAPSTTYTAGLYATQLALLMQHLKWEKAQIAGVSMVYCLTSIDVETVEFDIILRALLSL